VTDATPFQTAEAELERKNRELSLTTERLSVAARAAGIGIWDWNLATNELIWDDAMYRMYALPREEFGGVYEGWARRVHPDDRAAAEAEIEAALRGEHEYAAKFRIIWPDGSIRHIKADSQTLRDASGTPVRIVGTNMDVTERVRAEEALRSSEEKFRMAFTTGPDAFYLASIDDGKIIEVNPVFEDIFGYDRDEVIGKTSLELGLYRHPEDRARMLTELKSKGSVRDLELEGLKKTGEQISVSLSVSATVLHGQTLMLGVIKDITERKRAEATHERLQAELQQAQKMESVGRLAGGVAHDFNNLLTAITGYAAFVLDELAPADPARADVQEILAASERASALTAQLLAFSRKQVLKPQVLDLNTAVQGTISMLMRIVGEDVVFNTRLSAEPCWVLVDPGQLDQVLLNLSVNARDAMPSGGTLTLETGGGAGVVHLTIRDTGCGMSREVLSHLFEPFYTTKAQGKGTGLGLSTVYGIVQQSGGDIAVHSAPGLGTSVTISLRQADAAIAVVRDAHQADAHHGTETILLVEDEAVLRRLSARVLSASGYTVLTASNGDEALDIIDRHDHAIDLLVTDIVMPGMNGRDLARAVATRRPAIRTLFVSGYSDDAILHHGVLEPGIAFLHKPFAPEALLANVREVLDEVVARDSPLL
jgi:two-component system, cell cycle sensor histidine kinase and response regulator CckA